MSLPMGRGSMQVRSGRLVRKRRGPGRAVTARAAEREIRARVSDILLYCDSRREAHWYGMFALA
jgi:hypothetical protein